MKTSQQEIELEAIEDVKKIEVGELEHEIECPRCSDMMTLCSDFDFLYYACDQCGFVLSNYRKR